MRYFYMVTVALCMCIAARGQTFNYRYWFDDNHGDVVEGVSEASSWNLDIPLDGLAENALHVFHLQVEDALGQWSVPISRYFLKPTMTRDIDVEAMKCYYMIDGGPALSQMGTMSDGIYHLDIDVSTLSDGLHHMTYWLESDEGVITKTNLAYFTKIPLGGDGIIRYEYWLNDNYNTRYTEEIEPRQDDVSVLSLLPVESQPLRSSCFEFRMRNGLPIIYAKNDIHIRFTEATGRFTDVSKQFVDEKVSQQVEPVGELQETQTFDRVAENGIRWYTINLEEGDSVAFKSSQACTMQLFAPSGEEVYAASGSESVAFDGGHAWEDGTYYLAVHDVTGSQSRMTLEYMHMDKYDVLHYTPNIIGIAESIVEVNINGNGFDKLKEAKLQVSNNTIDAREVIISSKSVAKLIFDFSGQEKEGTYNLVLKFEENGQQETLTVNEPITLEKANWGNLTINVSMQPTSYRPYPVYIKVTNTGNVSLSYVPLNIAYDHPSEIEDVVFLNFYIPISEKTISEGYSPIVMTNNFLGEGIMANVINLFVRNIEPNETKEYVIGFTAANSVNFNLFVWTGQPLNQTDWNGGEETNIPSLIDYYKMMEFPLPTNNISSSSYMRKAQSLRQAAAIAQQVGQNAETTGRLMGNIVNGAAHYGDMARLNGYGVDPSDPLYNKIKNLHPVQPPSQIFNNPADASHWLSRLWEGQQNIASRNNPHPRQHPVNMMNSYDPNDIYGYTSESGSKYISKDVQKVNYTIEFENDPEFATASAHTVVVKDVLDKNLFDLASYKPTAIKIGDKIVDLNGDQTFVTTVDMRPAIDAIAQVDGMLDSKTGTVTWSFTSLDPMSMEPSYHVMQGFLPVNADGNGIGEVMFDINLKQQFPDGTEIPNQASIVFDTNEAILTPVWTNTIDAVAPTSHVSACEIKNDTTATLHFESEDNLSGVWKYDVYVQYEENASWTKVAEGVTEPECDVRIYEGINHGFYVVATDSAGNVEMKEAAREYTLDLFEPTEDSDLELELAEGWNWVSHNLNTSVDVADVQTHAKRILGQEEETIKDAAFGFVGDLTELKPTLGYKILVDADDNVALDGKLYNASYKSIGLSKGWNWIGYPLAHVMEIAQALEHFTPEEGDYIIGQDDFTQYADGEWVGTLSTLTPGLGYLYKSGATKQMFFNSTATLSSRAEAQRRVAAIESPWSCDKHKYPNVMAVTACLYNNEMAEDAGDYYVAAFCDNECRGVGKTVKGLVMMNVYGQGNETIQFKVIDKETEQLMDIAENVAFNADVQGSIAAPFRMTIGDGLTTDIANRSDLQIKITPAVIRNTMTVEIGAERIDRLTVTSMNGAVVANWKKLANGSTVDVSGLRAGVYVVTVKAGKQVFTKKVMKVTE